jgi:hypothetical protein
MEEDLHERAKNKKLRVTFSDGKVLCYKSTTMTFMETLRRIGIGALQNIYLECCHLPLISQEMYPRYKDWMKPLVRGWYVNTQSDSEQKYLQLSSIKQQLGLDIKIEIGTDFEVDKSRGFQKSHKRKNCLLVKFSDGHYVGGENPIDTYLETINEIGVSEIQRKGITCSGKYLITSSKLYSGQIQVGTNQWLVVPPQTKDKMKLLRVIGALMHIKLEVTVL